MNRQLPADCVEEIFKYLKDGTTLHSCLLVNRLWCELAVPIFWTEIRNYNTLIACLPNESKESLDKNQIIISTSTSNPPLFNYVPFIKSLSINEIRKGIEKVLLKNQQSVVIDNNKILVLTR